MSAKQQLNVRVSPVAIVQLEDIIEKAGESGRVLTKAYLVEQAILLIAKEYSEKGEYARF